jgi:pilus assembly protein Flp/PilA
MPPSLQTFSELVTHGEEVTLRMINASMIKMMNRVQMRDEEGQALVEYALILALIAVFAIGALQALGTSVADTLNAIASAVAGA